jgi:hypothetical protein
MHAMGGRPLVRGGHPMGAGAAPEEGEAERVDGQGTNLSGYEVGAPCHSKPPEDLHTPLACHQFCEGPVERPADRQ